MHHKNCTRLDCDFCNRFMKDTPHTTTPDVEKIVEEFDVFLDRFTGKVQHRDNEIFATLYADTVKVRKDLIIKELRTTLIAYRETVRAEEREKTLQNTFLLTDSCMWEANKQEGTRSEHCIEVVDDKTGQVRFIASGSRIKFLEGSISEVHTQEKYNEEQEETATPPQETNQTLN